MKAFYIYLYFLMMISFPVLLSAQDGEGEADSLRKVIAGSSADSVKARAFCRLCEHYQAVGQYAEALRHGTEGLNLSQKNQDLKSEAFCLQRLGTLYSEQGAFSQAMECFQKSKAINEQRGNRQGLAFDHLQTGYIYNEQGNYPQAMECFTSAYSIYRQVKNQIGIGNCYNAIGWLYDQRNENGKALDYFQKSLKIYEEAKDSISMISCLNNIGLVYDKMKDYDRALSEYQKGLMIAQRAGDPSGTVIYLANIGSVFKNRGDYGSALDYYGKALKISTEIENDYQSGTLYTNLSTVYLLTGRLPEARNYARRGLEIALQIKQVENITNGSRAAYKADSALGDWKSAFEHHKLFKQYSDSLNNEDKAKEFGKIESKYEFEKQSQTQKRTAETEARLRKTEQERRDNLQYLIIFAGIIGLFTGLLFIGKLKIPTKITEVFIFAGLLITFEFLLIFFDPYFEKYSGGIPFYKLGFNTLIAFGFAPLHSFLESRLKRRLVKGENA